MNHAKNKTAWCLKKAEKEIKQNRSHRGLIKIRPDVKKAREHILKAEHNLKATLYLRKGGFTDWCSSALFYAIYHCLLSILAKFGYESKNQECTFVLVESLIEDGLIDIKKEDMNKISSIDIEEKQKSATAVSIREAYQYTTKLTLEDKTLDELLNLAKKILDETKVIVEK